ncbi:hypothetical protein BpHYR1_032585 [Brachionus plicatilis]|uniref:Uncharacterized protein n=1 Tax=Brachionus plicatilis TaxID=10195 RepID=A0A3M7QJU2_BRAPC|nr:hypothetical protein BpHYR1_032585 [Brachionus plicatilis]
MTSTLEHLQASNKESAKKNTKKIKRPFGQVLTEIDVLKQLEEEENLKYQKKLNQKAKKRKRETPTAQTTQNVKPRCSKDVDVEECLSTEKQCFKFRV